MQSLESLDDVRAFTAPLLVPPVEGADMHPLIVDTLQTVVSEQAAESLATLAGDCPEVALGYVAMGLRSHDKVPEAAAAEALLQVAAYRDRHVLAVASGRQYVLRSLRNYERSLWTESVLHGGSAQAYERTYQLKVAATRAIPRRSSSAMPYLAMFIQLEPALERMEALALRSK